MKSKIILGLIMVIFGATLALPTLAAETATTPALTPVQYLKSQLTYEAINAVNGVVVNLGSTNPNWVAKMHEKYDNLPKTSKKYFDNQIEIDLLKTDNGIQAIITVLHPAGSNYQSLVEKTQQKFASLGSAAENFLKFRFFLKNGFSWSF